MPNYQDPFLKSEPGPNAEWAGHYRRPKPLTMADLPQDQPRVPPPVYYNPPQKPKPIPEWAQPKPPPTFGQMATGLKEAVVDPMKRDIGGAYWAQRAARARYPVADAALNFVPYVGTAANLDDMVHDVARRAPVDAAMDAAGAYINNQHISKGLGGATAVASAVNQARKGMGGRAMALMVGAPVTGYIDHVAKKQKEASQLYGNSTIPEIAGRMRAEGLGGKGLQPNQYEDALARNK